MYRTPRVRNPARAGNNDPDVLNNELLNYYNINSNWDYRKLLQSQGTNIMNQNLDFAVNQNSHFVNDPNQSTSFQSPYIFKSVHEIPPNISNLHQAYLTQQSNQATMIAPSIPIQKK